MKVAFQGETGAFSEAAVQALYPKALTVPKVSMEAVFAAVTSGEADCGVVPIENSLFGSVHVNYDLLMASDVRIVDEVKVRIRHHLLALPQTRLSNINSVHSHPQALGQCQDFLRKMLPHAHVVPAYDTAGAAKMVAGRGLRAEAAIASRRAAEEYGLEVVAASIESHHQNFTRFLALASAAGPARAVARAAPLKTSLAFALQSNVPGALFKSLATFALRDLNLFKIESRPLIGSPGEYLFYLDIEGSAEDEGVERALAHLSELTALLKVLGSYPQGKSWDEHNHNT